LIARGTQALLDDDLSFRQSQVDCSAICARIFGQEYASLLAKAAEVAAQRERKAAARA
jgi:hypothetical protein